jgi:phage terminase large subunit GpA-like protein
MASLADLQTEREALRAARAKREFDEAEAATLTQAAVLAAGLAARRSVLDGLDELVEQMLQAIEGEHEETRVHYRLSDSAHDWLTALGQKVLAVSAAAPDFGARFNSGVKPRGLLTVSQWADRYRKMATGTNMPGPWHTALTPYLREIMDSLSEHSAVSRVVFLKSVQVGATEVLNNWLGYVMHHLKNKDCLVVVPSKEYRNQKFNPRFNRALSESDCLKELITTASRNKKNTEDVIEYGIGAKIVKAGANVSTDLRSDPFPYVACDEIDEFPAEIPGSGDPMTLIEGRQTTFSRAKTLLVSTPKVEHTSRIDAEYRKSDRRRYHVPCPHCGEPQHLEWKNLHWDASRIEGQDGTPEHERVNRVTAVWYECAACHQPIEEGHKTDMLAAGKWIPERPGITAVRGYHINSLYAPVGLGRNWHWLAEKWLACQGNTSELQAFVNERLGEVWREMGDNIEDLALLARLEKYPEKPPIKLITAGVDVQKDRLEMTIDGWGAGEECWTLDHVILPGDTARPEVWEDLAEAMSVAGVQYAGIDSGFNTSMVYAFCEKRRWCVAMKGVTGMGRPLIEDEKKRRQRLRTRRKKGAPVEPIGVDQGKVLLYARLKLLQPGAGYIHFPSDAAFDDEYFAQLAAEKLVTKIKGTRPFQEWVQTRPRNETLDCKVYSLAAMRLAGKDLAGNDMAGRITLEQWGRR